MSNPLKYIIRELIAEVIVEQMQQQVQDEQPKASVFDPQQQRFLGSFAAAGAPQLGIIYSLSDIGIREFVARSGTQYGCTPAVLLSLLRGKYIKLVPYTGLGQNTDYTIELQLPLEAVQQFASLVGKKDGEGESSDSTVGDTSSPSSGGGGSFGGGGGGLPPMDAPGGEDIPDVPPAEEEPLPDAPPTEEEPALDIAHVVKYGDLLKESVTIAKKLMLESSKSKKKVRPSHK